MTDETTVTEVPQDEPASTDTVTAEGADVPVSPSFDLPPNVSAEQPAQLGAVEDAAPHPGVFRLDQAQGLPEVDADTPTWAHYAPPAGAITRFKSVDRRTMEVVMLADEGRGLAARQA